MSQFTIYHNARCSKSRETLALLQKHGIEPTVIEYLSTPLSAAELNVLLKKLKLKAIDIIRKKEAEFKALGLHPEMSDPQLIQAMIQAPKLMERPIVVRGSKAVLARPPEKVLELLI